MHTRSRLVLAAIAAALALAVGPSAASAARSFSISNNALSAYVTPRTTFFGTPSENLVICTVTLTASLHSTVAKARGSLVGFVNGGRLERCTSTIFPVRLIPLVEHRSPFHMTLNSFKGTLPRITEILLTINNFRLLTQATEPFGRTQGCLYRANLDMETRGRTGAAEYTVELFIQQQSGRNWEVFEDRLNESIMSCDERLGYVGTFHASSPPVIRLI